jgi:hypothetical protein
LSIEGMKHIADRLFVAAQSLANDAGSLASGTGEQELTAA